MIKKVVRVRRIGTFDEAKEDQAYWMTRPLEERIGMVETLRRELHESEPRLQRVSRTIQRPRR